MKIKTSKLKGLALDWAVGKAVGVDVRIGKEFIVDAKCWVTYGYRELQLNLVDKTIAK
ncbi:TPA: hypothetical protein M3A53_000765 [Proteus mirabilis]|nr:hypothetical protein [Proteus mirabilis]